MGRDESVVKVKELGNPRRIGSESLIDSNKFLTLIIRDQFHCGTRNHHN